ncbi:MAG TPA: ATP-binding protein [Bryobacteraceae bacterium]|jgi:C4-dicarboxylate-specific signal transduction histidine kinase|nr:ATP-binding protein [Bryobacteraceae bacterium]
MEDAPSPRRYIFSILRFVLAVALVAGALALTLLLQSVVSTAGFLFFYIAVVASTWFAGKWPGALAVVLSALAVVYFFTPPIHSFEVDQQSLPVFIEFAASSVVVGWFSSWRKQADAELRYARDELQLRVEERTAELRQSNEQLLAEMAERKRAEDAYFEAQAELARVTRIGAMGALAASISHEINQPLAAVVTNADACMMWLSSEPPNLEEARAAVGSIAQQGTRASDVVRHIRAMFTKAAPERTQVQMNDLIREVSVLVEGAALRNQVVLQTELAADLRASMGDRVQLQQVIVNLILNGIEAMSEVTNRPRRLLIRSLMQNPDEVLIAVRDSGIGIDPKNAKRIFDAFFTTKAQGMGMGLSLSHSIIEAHGGRMWASSNDDHGVTLQFTLPVERETTA